MEISGVSYHAVTLEDHASIVKGNLRVFDLAGVIRKRYALSSQRGGKLRAGGYALLFPEPYRLLVLAPVDPSLLVIIIPQSRSLCNAITSFATNIITPLSHTVSHLSVTIKINKLLSFAIDNL